MVQRTIIFLMNTITLAKSLQLSAYKYSLWSIFIIVLDGYF